MKTKTELPPSYSSQESTPLKPDISAVVIAELIPILQRSLPMEVSLFVFGSRAKGCARQFSDLDLLICSHQTIELNTLDLLEEALSESNIPYRVEVISRDFISDEFYAAIQPDCLELNFLKL